MVYLVAMRGMEEDGERARRKEKVIMKIEKVAERPALLLDASAFCQLQTHQGLCTR